MEENILKILLSHIEAVTEKNSPFVPTAINGVPQSAKEIASHFREFIEWMYEKEFFYGTLSEGYLSTIHDTPKFNSVDEIYNYWITNVKPAKVNKL